ncbi:MAG: FAD-binding oxidoreductase [Archangiaceae bacterium]|nr:FAD-binding oxidoreductase [Archangiaceae bacterium]
MRFSAPVVDATLTAVPLFSALAFAPHFAPVPPPGPMPPGVEVLNAFAWSNYGTNLSANVGTLYRLSNGPQNQAAVGLDAIRWAVRHLASSNGSGSVSGSRWSFSGVALSDRAMFDVRAMAKRLAFAAGDLADPAEAASLVQVQAGCTVEQLIAYAEGLGRDLPAMGGNCGQTVAGAISTGTHGGFVDRPGFPEMVRALYLVGEDGTRHWLERGAKPVLSASAVAAYRSAGVQVHTDDAYFEHAVVSLGTFGLIYAVVLETVPAYGVRLDRRAVDFDDALDAQAFDRDFSAYGPDPVLDFAAVVNPYRMSLQGGRWRGNGVGTAVRTVLQPAPLGAPPPPGGNVSSPINDADLSRLLAAFATVLPGAVSPLVDVLMASLYGPRSAVGPMSVGYPLALTHAPTLGMELGFPAARAREALGVALDYLHRAPTPLPGVLALRQTPQSKATFSLARWAPTATLEFCLLKVPGTEELLTGLLEQFDRQAFEFTVHLGMLHGRSSAGQAFLTPERFARMFGGPAVIASWLAARRSSCPRGTVFSNPLTRSLGLTS